MVIGHLLSRLVYLYWCYLSYVAIYIFVAILWDIRLSDAWKTSVEHILLFPIDQYVRLSVTISVPETRGAPLNSNGSFVIEDKGRDFRTTSILFNRVENSKYLTEVYFEWLQTRFPQSSHMRCSRWNRWQLESVRDIFISYIIRYCFYKLWKFTTKNSFGSQEICSIIWH